MRILVICTGNSCRSQMAQGFLQSFDKNLHVFSAGTHPADSVSKKAIAVMKEAGIDISSNRPKSIELYLTDVWDYVITVCDEANETCPIFTGNVKHRVHLGFEDPSLFNGSDDNINNEFRRIRDNIRKEFYTFYLDNLKPELNGKKG